MPRSYGRRSLARSIRDQALDRRRDFGLRLRAIRVQVGISQEELADRAGLHRTYISSVERGKRNISLANIHALADALGVDAKDLFTGDAL